MTQEDLTYEEIEQQIASKADVFEAIDKARLEANPHLAAPSPAYAARLSRGEIAAGARTFRLMAQGDSWFDYFPGKDIVDCLQDLYGHSFAGANGATTRLAIGGSTLNQIAYGAVSSVFGVPQAAEVTRLAELVRRIKLDRPQALLLSAGGNDVAGDEFFSFINNKDSGLPPVNAEVVAGVLNQTFKTAYERVISFSLRAAGTTGMKIFLHGYDYPWPDGRGVLNLPGWKVGPWFDASFREKNFPYRSGADLQLRHDIVARFIDPLNGMLETLAGRYPGRVFYVNLRGTLHSTQDWANELHPTNSGFGMLAARVNDALQAHL